MEKPTKSFWQIWNMSFGFFGIQFGWGLQMANMSAIYEYLGARADQIPILWLAAPLTGLIVQPIIGHASDHTWGRLGRRRPYFLVGALLSSHPDAALLRTMDGRRPPLDPRRFHQHQHGAFSCLRRRSAPRAAVYRRIRHAEPLHRTRRGRRLRAALDADELVPARRRNCTPHHPPHRAPLLLCRRRSLFWGCSLDHPDHEGVSPRRHGGVPAPQGRSARPRC